nr:hypothetical protein [uncultured Agathobaculum sp.]
MGRLTLRRFAAEETKKRKGQFLPLRFFENRLLSYTLTFPGQQYIRQILNEKEGFHVI